MRHLGLLLITLGFIGGSLVAVLDKQAVDFTWFLPCLGIGAIGVALVQVAIRREATDQGRTGTNMKVLNSSLASIVSKMAQLDETKQDIFVYDLPDRIDEAFRDDISNFVGSRESIAHVHGMQAYGDVMSHFAAAERYLNRVWSCAADGYVDEAQTYISRSHEQFREALSKLESLEAPSQPA